MMPPYVVRLHVESPERRTVRLWLPLFLLWPLLLVLGVLALVLTILVDVALALFGQRYHYYTLLLLGCFSLVNELRGTSVDISNEGTVVRFVLN